MLYAILCYNQEDAVAAWTQDENDKVMGDLSAVRRKWIEAGRLGPVARLLPTTAATTVRKGQGEALVLDGPFAETKEQLLGFYLVDCASLEEALEAARDLLAANPSSTYEVRPVGVYHPPGEL